MINIADIVRSVRDFIDPRVSEEDIRNMVIGESYSILTPRMKYDVHKGTLSNVNTEGRTITLENGVTTRVHAFAWNGTGDFKWRHRRFDNVEIEFDDIKYFRETSRECSPFNECRGE